MVQRPQRDHALKFWWHREGRWHSLPRFCLMLFTSAPIAPPQGFRINFKDFYNLYGMKNISETAKTHVGWAVLLTLALWSWAITWHKLSFLITDSSKPVSAHGADPVCYLAYCKHGYTVSILMSSSASPIRNLLHANLTCHSLWSECAALPSASSPQREEKGTGRVMGLCQSLFWVQTMALK